LSAIIAVRSKRSQIRPDNALVDGRTSSHAAPPAKRCDMQIVDRRRKRIGQRIGIELRLVAERGIRRTSTSIAIGEPFNSERNSSSVRVTAARWNRQNRHSPVMAIGAR
jgi:hypothetical protein